MIYTLCLVLFMVGLYAVIVKKNVVKIVLGIAIMEYAVNLFLVLLGYRSEGLPPILEKGMEAGELSTRSVDPLPQALVLTSIVIGLGLVALMVAICIRLYERYGTFDLTKMNKLKG